jgi:hypothetical protein
MIRRRVSKPVIALTAALAINGCATFDFLTDNCRSEWVQVDWPVSITRNGVTTTTTLKGSVAPGNIDQSQFDLFKEIVATGGRELVTNVIWSVPAFEVNGGFIGIMHEAPLAAGQNLGVGVFDGGGWGIPSEAIRVEGALVSVRADNFVARTATGSVTAIQSIPLKLRVDVTAGNAAGETIRIVGDAVFSYHVERDRCS